MARHVDLGCRSWHPRVGQKGCAGMGNCHGVASVFGREPTKRRPLLAKTELRGKLRQTIDSGSPCSDQRSRVFRAACRGAGNSKGSKRSMKPRLSAGGAPKSQNTAPIRGNRARPLDSSPARAHGWATSARGRDTPRRPRVTRISTRRRLASAAGHDQPIRPSSRWPVAVQTRCLGAPGRRAPLRRWPVGWNVRMSQPPTRPLTPSSTAAPLP